MAQILFASIPLAGHTNQLMILAEEMSRRGHRVCFAAGHAFREQIEAGGVQFVEWDQESVVSESALLTSFKDVWELASRERHILRGEKIIHHALIDTYASMYSALKPTLSRLAPDLVIADSAAIPAMDLALQAEIPTVILAQFLGNHVPTPSAYPQYGTSFQMKMSFYERLLNRLHPLKKIYYLLGAFSKLEARRKECSVPFSLVELSQRSLMLVSTAFGVEIPRSLPPYVQMVGPILPRSLAELPPDLGEWINHRSPKDVVYVSFGTLATLDRKQIETLVAGLTSDSFRVLWSLRKSQQALLPILPAHFLVKEYVPQHAILQHPAVKAFVTHCGMNSISESLYFEKPMLTLPMFGDQHYNAARIVDLGAGLRLNKESFTSTEVKTKIQQVLSDPTIQSRVRSLGSVQRAHRGLDRAADILEAVLASGYDHLRPVPGIAASPTALTSPGVALRSDDKEADI